MPKFLFILCLALLSIRVFAQPVIQRDSTTIFAVIGDFGDNSKREAEVALLVRRLEPEFIITTGDNNYPAGQAETIDTNIGQYYSDFIYPYYGAYGQGSVTENRFFPSLGNHDWETGSVQPFTDYFSLPGNERYYELSWGPVRLFALDSDPREPDGYESNSIQAQWLEERLGAANEPWRIVYTHLPPYSSVEAYGTESINWPYAEWGASAVFSGHAHSYERLEIGGLTYVVNGLGGANVNDIDEAIEGSRFRFNAAHGAMLVEVTETSLSMNFYGIYGRPLASVSRNPIAGNWIEFDISQAITGEGIYSFILDTTITGTLAFNSSESAENQPQLVLDITGTDGAMSLIATEDATVDNERPNRNRGQAPLIRVIRTATAQQRAYLQFQIPAISSPIEGAVLRLYLESTDPKARGGIAVYRADSNLWTDETISWNNAPTILLDDRPIDSYRIDR